MKLLVFKEAERLVAEQLAVREERLVVLLAELPAELLVELPVEQLLVQLLVEKVLLVAAPVVVSRAQAKAEKAMAAPILVE